MRAVALLLVVLGLFSASQAVDLADLGTSLINGLVEQGKQALKNAATSLLSSLLGTIGKRELLQKPVVEHVKGLISKLGGVFDKLKEHGTGFFKGALAKLKNAAAKLQATIGTLTGSKDVADVVDPIVKDHDQKQKRLIADLLQKGTEILSALHGKAKELAAAVKAKASDLVSTLLQKGSDLLIGRRNILSDHLSALGNAFGSALGPLSDIVSTVGNTLKGHFSNLVDTVKGHAVALKDKLAGHASDLKTHGQNLLEHGKTAVGALSEVVSDILKQTLENAKPHIQGVADTLNDGLKTAVGHLGGSDSA